MTSPKPPRSFQEIILRLQTYWAGQGCAVLQPYDMEVGAGTFHPATTLRALGQRSWAAAYDQVLRAGELGLGVWGGADVWMDASMDK